jgi:hypothetical protein
VSGLLDRGVTIPTVDLQLAYVMLMAEWNRLGFGHSYISIPWREVETDHRRNRPYDQHHKAKETG